MSPFKHVLPFLDDLGFLFSNTFLFVLNIKFRAFLLVSFVDCSFLRSKPFRQSTNKHSLINFHAQSCINAFNERKLPFFLSNFRINYVVNFPTKCLFLQKITSKSSMIPVFQSEVAAVLRAFQPKKSLLHFISL